MASLIFANNASAALAGSINATQTNITLQTGQGAIFTDPSGQIPNVAGGLTMKATLTDVATGLVNEIVLITAVSGDVLTVVRGQEGIAASAFAAGDFFRGLVTAGTVGAMVQSISIHPARAITASGLFVINTTDAGGFVGLNRVTSVAVSNAVLPSGANVGDTYAIQDLNNNFNAFPVTITPPAGMTIAKRSSVVLNVNGQTATFTYYGSNLWGVRFQ